MTCLHFCSHGAALLVRWFGSGRRSELKGSKIAGQVKEAKGGRNKSRLLSLMLAHGTVRHSIACPGSPLPSPAPNGTVPVFLACGTGGRGSTDRPNLQQT